MGPLPEPHRGELEAVAQIPLLLDEGSGKRSILASAQIDHHQEDAAAELLRQGGALEAPGGQVPGFGAKFEFEADSNPAWIVRSPDHQHAIGREFREIDGDILPVEGLGARVVPEGLENGSRKEPQQDLSQLVGLFMAHRAPLRHPVKPGSVPTVSRVQGGLKIQLTRHFAYASAAAILPAQARRSFAGDRSRAVWRDARRDHPCIAGSETLHRTSGALAGWWPGSSPVNRAGAR